MPSIPNTVVLATCAVATLFGQTADTRIMPLPLVSPTTVKAGVTPDALTPGEKAKMAFMNTFGPQAIGNRVLAAGWDQLRGHPEEWGGGMDAYGKRFGSQMGRVAVRNSIRLGTDVALGIDPRYDRCDCSGFRARTGHAWKRILVSRSDAGNEMPAYSNFAGAYITPMITDSWYPDRLNTWNHKLQSGTFHLAWRGVGNMVREFWPDMKRGMRRGSKDN